MGYDGLNVRDVCQVGIVDKKDKKPPEPDFTCERCGKCCKTYSFWLGKPFDDDLAKLIAYHGCIPVKNEEDEMGVVIPLTCLHLDFDETGKTSCRIYSKRPDVCKQYFCKKCKDKAVQEIADGLHLQ